MQSYYERVPCPCGGELIEIGVNLQAGRFYESRNGHTWCCFMTNPRAPESSYASCIRIRDSLVEHFFSDGRYDPEGKREHTLIKEVPTPS